MFFRFLLILLVSMFAMSHCQDGVRKESQKPGVCPRGSKRGSVGICAFTCKGDQSCKGDMKCCSTPCGGTQCVKPVNGTQPSKKPGTCPANKPGVSGICIVECSNDYDCKGDLKCCPNPCGGGVCVKSVEASKPVVKNPGACPVIRPGEVGICANLCTDNSACNDGQICCPTACGGSQCATPVNNTQPASKPGTCPQNKPGEVGICIVECSNDYDCKGDLKCCRNPCGGGVCVKSVEASQPATKPGTCPQNKPGEVGICFDQCSNDYDCKGDLKCCPNPCGGGACVKSVEASQPANKNGTCPVNKPDESGICIVECSNDYDCKGDLKCCPNPCGGGVCVKSIEASQPSNKPGTCPANKPGVSGICIVECSNDYDCKGDLKCCPNPCGGGVCVKSVEASQPATKPGTCPENKPGEVGICFDQCSNDYDCKGDLKCCPNPCGGGACVKSVEASQPARKSGTCPAIGRESLGACGVKCNDDSSCEGDLICCTDSCGGSSCMTPVESSQCNAY